MIRRAAAVDANQSEIVANLRKLGVHVEVCSAVGKGFPDLVVIYAGSAHFLELKDGNKSASRRNTTKDQKLLHAAWRRHGVTVHVAKNLGEAIAAIGMKFAIT